MKQKKDCLYNVQWRDGTGTQRLFSVKYLLGEAKIAWTFLQLEEG